MQVLCIIMHEENENAPSISIIYKMQSMDGLSDFKTTNDTITILESNVILTVIQ